jgi:4-hydroxy-3-methylbut-2-enyl diphosphate reductase
MPSKNHSRIFRSRLTDEVRSAGNVWVLPQGQLLLPRVFGFCRGVERALEMLEKASMSAGPSGKKFFLLGQIIHNPWVNEHFRSRGVQILSEAQIADLQQIITPNDCAVIPAFGVRPEVNRRLKRIGCQIVDTSCGDVRRLWNWVIKAAADGYGVLIFGRAQHDETVVTKSLLAECGGRYLIVGNIPQVQLFCDLLVGKNAPADFGHAFDAESTNAESIEPFLRLAQVSQTTMLYDETIAVREMIAQAFRRRFDAAEVQARLCFQPTVCRATQDRQAAAVELCQSGCDLVIVVGGYGSSNTRHLYELARQHAQAYFIEDAKSIAPGNRLHTIDAATNQAVVLDNWLPKRRPLKIAILAGASTPETVVAEVMRNLAEYLK